MTQVFIVGFGQFGKKALARVSSFGEKGRIWIIDHSPEVLDRKDPYSGIRVLADGPQFLTKYQDWIKDEDWIIPTLPVHLAWKWLDLNLKTPGGHRAVSPPKTFGSDLPYCQRYGEGLFLSYASFVCPEDCPAPASHCFKTKIKRPIPLWQFIADQKGRNTGLEVIQSRQLGPGVGGYPFGELRRIKNQAMVSPRPYFIATACRCHGVIHGLTW